MTGDGTEKCTRYKNEDGNVYKCTHKGGSEESTYPALHYYDSKQQLRFVFVRIAAINGAIAGYRIHFNESSKRIWRIRKFETKGRYPFTEIWPDDLILSGLRSAIYVD